VRTEELHAPAQVGLAEPLLFRLEKVEEMQRVFNSVVEEYRGDSQTFLRAVQDRLRE